MKMLPVRTFPIFNSTCVAFFHISNKTYYENTGLHPVWGRLPATALVMSDFPKAETLLYMDTDAMLASADHTPTSMYEALARAHKTNVTLQTLEPSLIVNKPMKGWLCKVQCDKYSLGHGCFNSGVLLWRRSEGAKLILRAWWESRLDNTTQNFHHETRGWFDGWGNGKRNYGYKMSEQNRLMYIYHTNPAVQSRVLPVPKQLGPGKSASCPEVVDATTTPCLQNDDAYNRRWNRTSWNCFINHHANTKDVLYRYYERIINPPPWG